MSQVIKIKRGGISGISGASTVKGELIIATGSLGNNASGPFLLAHGDNLGLVAGAVFTGSSVPTITDSELNGILFYDSANSRFMRLDSSGNQALNIAATGFTGDTDDVAEGSTNLYFTNARADARIAAASVTDLTDVSSAGSGIIITAGERTQLTTAAAFTASLDADLATFSVPASTTISAFGKTLVDDADAGTARTTLGLGTAATTAASAYATAAQGALADSAQQPPSEGAFVNGDKTKLDGIEASADVTDTSNVRLAGALMDDELTEIATVKALTAAGISGSFNVASASFSTRVTTNDAKLTANTSNVRSAGALMDDELSSISDVKALDQSVVSGASPTFTTTNFTDATNKRLLTDAQEAKIDALDQALATTSNVTFASASLANLTVTGNASIQGTLTTVNSNDVNIGDRIITLNTADGAGDAGIHVHDTNGAQTASIVWDTDGDYWKVGVVGSTQYRLVEWDGEVAGGGDFLVTNADGRIDALNTTTAGDILQSDGDGTFTITNTIDGGSY